MNERTPMSSCRSCGADIIWVVTENGKKMPVDAEPEKGGTFFLEERMGEAPLAKFIREDERPTTPLYVSHFATCPDSKEHRRR